MPVTDKRLTHCTRKPYGFSPLPEDVMPPLNPLCAIAAALLSTVLFSACLKKEASASAGQSDSAVEVSIPRPPAAQTVAQGERDAIVTAYEETIAGLTPVQTGSPENEVLARLGEPDGVMTLGGRKRLSYGEGSVMIANGTVLAINGISEERLAAPDPEAYSAYQKAQGKVFYNGRWMTEVESQAAYMTTLQARREAEIRKARAREELARQAQANARYAEAQARKAAPFRDIRRNGAAIEVAELIVPGKITVVDFYADWCGPCRKIAPHLKALADDPQIVVRKVDIVNWKSPVAKQWQLRSIPNMRVYDRSGKQVGAATSSLQRIQNYIAEAK